VPWSPLKVSLKIGLHEGIAVAADWNEGRLTGHQWAKAMRQLEVAPPLSGIMGIGFWGHAGSRSYLFAGSFVRFLVDTYGIEKFMRVFPTGNFIKGYSKNLRVLEAEWIEFLKSVPLREEDLVYAAHRLKRGGIFEQVCAHEMAALRDIAWRAYHRKDFTTAVQTFEAMLSDEPNNLRNLRGLMLSAYQMQNYERALSLATRIANSENTRLSAEAMRLKGDIYWLQNAHEKAMNAYGAVKTEHETIAHGLLKRLVALSYPSSNAGTAQHPVASSHVLRKAQIGESENLRLRALLRSVLVEPKPAAEKMAHLSICQQAAPNEWLAYFLAGELLHKEGAWEVSNQYLRQAMNLSIPQQYAKLVLEARRLIGINAYLQKDYETAQNAFHSIADNTALPLGVVHSAKDWIQRCQWAQSRTP